MNRPAGDVFFVQPRHVCLHCLETKSKLSGKLDGPSFGRLGRNTGHGQNFRSPKIRIFWDCRK
jgi:hypothetical protein